MRKASLASVSTIAFRLSGLVLMAGIAGCSSDVNRIEMPWSVPVASNAATQDFQNDTTGSIGSSSLQAKPQSFTPVAQAPLASPGSWNTPVATVSKPVQPLITASSGETVVVGQGDTVYGIARKYEVPVGTLMVMNNITSATEVKPGQVLKLPQGALSAKAATPTASFAASAPASTSDVATKIAVAKETKATALIQDKVKPVQQAKAIAETKVVAAAKPTVPLIAESKTAVAEIKKDIPKKAEIAAAPVKAQIAAVEDKAEVTASLPNPAPMNSTEFRWPVRGRVVQSFGPLQGGGRNDGINIAVPAGTPIKAAENGVVAYAGSELKGYGNLILIRHDNDFVTAYAHSSDIKVKRGDKVTRGQIIGSAGQTGNVTQPQLHFEIRKGSSPVNPLSHLAGG